MLSFESDYINGCHPKILEKLIQTNLESMSGYGNDPYYASAGEKIKEWTKCETADVCFLVGGTQTNQLIVDTVLQPYEGVIAATTGHVSLHEAGAIEYTGHKVIELPGKDGKLPADVLSAYLKTFYGDENREHMTFPGMVYISFPTEYGTIYSKAELTALSEICHEYNIPLYVDGARLGYGLNGVGNDVTIEDLAKLVDIFYIGGTKVGALLGEGIVFTHHNTPPHFVNRMKQHGALLAKGRVLGIQFDTLFTDDLYMKIGKHAIDLAVELKKVFASKNIPLYLDSPTNQQFVILENEKMKALSEHVKFSFWEAYDETHTVVRFATSWSTTEEDIRALEALL